MGRMLPTEPPPNSLFWAFIKVSKWLSEYHTDISWWQCGMLQNSVSNQACHKSAQKSFLVTQGEHWAATQTPHPCLFWNSHMKEFLNNKIKKKCIAHEETQPSRWFKAYPSILWAISLFKGLCTKQSSSNQIPNLQTMRGIRLCDFSRWPGFYKGNFMFSCQVVPLCIKSFAH